MSVLEAAPLAVGARGGQAAVLEALPHQQAAPAPAAPAAADSQELAAAPQGAGGQRPREDDDGAESSLPRQPSLSTGAQGSETVRQSPAGQGSPAAPAGSAGEQPRRAAAPASTGQGYETVERLKWTPSLHERFVEAFNACGGAMAAKPKEILDAMQIPGLSLNHVKSHLQKYRRTMQPQDFGHLGPLLETQDAKRQRTSRSLAQDPSVALPMQPSQPQVNLVMPGPGPGLNIFQGHHATASDPTNSPAFKQQSLLRSAQSAFQPALASTAASLLPPKSILSGPFNQGQAARGDAPLRRQSPGSLAGVQELLQPGQDQPQQQRQEQRREQQQRQVQAPQDPPQEQQEGASLAASALQAFAGALACPPGPQPRAGATAPREGSLAVHQPGQESLAHLVDQILRQTGLTPQRASQPQHGDGGPGVAGLATGQAPRADPPPGQEHQPRHGQGQQSARPPLEAAARQSEQSRPRPALAAAGQAGGQEHQASAGPAPGAAGSQESADGAEFEPRGGGAAGGGALAGAGLCGEGLALSQAPGVTRLLGVVLQQQLDALVRLQEDLRSTMALFVQAQEQVYHHMDTLARLGQALQCVERMLPPRSGLGGYAGGAPMGAAGFEAQLQGLAAFPEAAPVFGHREPPPADAALLPGLAARLACLQQLAAHNSALRLP